MGSEVKDFATAFMQGYKIFSDAEKTGRRSGKDDTYSVDNLAKGDPRISGSGNFLTRMFGSEDTPKLESWDRARAILDQKARVAIENGDVKTYKQTLQDMKDLEALSKNPVVGPRPGTEPERPSGAVPAAKSTTPSKAPAAPPVQKEEPKKEAPYEPYNPDGSLKVPTGSPQKQGALDESSSGTLSSLDPNRVLEKGGYKEPAVEVTEAQPGEVVAPNVDVAQADVDTEDTFGDSYSIADGSSLFSPDFGGMGDVMIGATGGMVPTRYAAVGGSMNRIDGDTGGVGVSNPGALYTGPGEWGYQPPGPDDDPDEEPGTPTLYNPTAPAVGDDERGDRTGSLNLPSDPEELGREAMAAMDAGLKRINAEFASRGAVGQDPEYRTKLEAFARGQGRLSDDEIAMIDKAIDPDGKMSPAMKSALRMAAPYKFMLDQGDEEGANNFAARMLLRNKFEAGARAQMAVAALRDGDTESGVKLLTDAINLNMPDAREIRAKANPDGSADYESGYDRAGGFVPVEKGRIPRDQLIQLAANTSRPDWQINAISSSVENAKRGGGRKGKPDEPGDTPDFKKARENYTAAERALNTLPADATAEARQAAFDKAREAWGNVVASAPGAKLSTKAYNVQNGYGLRPPSMPGAPTTGGKGGGSAEARAEAAENAQLDAFDRERRAIDAGQAAASGVAVGGIPIRERLPRVSEATAAEISRRTYGRNTPDYYNRDSGVGGAAARDREDVDLRNAEVTYGNANKRTDFKEDPKDRIATYEESLAALEKEGKPDLKKKGKIDTSRPPIEPLTGNDRRRFFDLVDRVAGANDKNPDSIVRAMHSATQNLDPKAAPKLVSDGKRGIVLEMAGERFTIDREAYRQIAMLRGEKLAQARENTAKAAEDKRQADAKQASSTASSRFDIDDRELQNSIQTPGLLQRGAGAITGVAPNPVLRATPKQMMNNAARERWRKFYEENPDFRRE